MSEGYQPAAIEEAENKPMHYITGMRGVMKKLFLEVPHGATEAEIQQNFAAVEKFINDPDLRVCLLSPGWKVTEFPAEFPEAGLVRTKPDLEIQT